ncbi:MAG: zinc ribbon domain-containing protein [Verrucomicrobiaceae bacterium]|nr:zinc ribbon domain-containing protein [Verrucomicrobiaceae bacterium]
MSRFCPACGAPLPEGAKFCAACGHSMDVESRSPGPPALPDNPAPGFSFDNAAAFIEVTKRLPWKQRPEVWWNTFSVLAGATGGLLWFVYSSIRGLPKPGFLVRMQLGPWLDFLPALAMLFLAWIKRRSLVARVFQLQQRFERTSSAGKAGLAAMLLGGAWLLMKKILPKLGMGGEGLDVISPVLMFLLPLMLVMFRRETDKLLAPVQPLRRSLGPVVAMGMSVAAPFATAYLLYHVFGYREYPLMHMNLPTGFLASYALARNPAVSHAPPKLPIASWLIMLLPACLYLALAGDARAHDFLRDPFNLNDGLRTDAFAPVIAGVATAVVSILVNGVEITRTIIQDTKPVEEGEKPEQRNYKVDVRTVDAQGRPGTVVREGNPGMIYIYASCSNETGPFPAGDATIRFPSSLGAAGLVIDDLGTQNGERCACVSLPTPVQGSVPASITVTVTAGNGQWVIPVKLQVDIGLVLAAEMINANKPYGVKRDYPVFDAWTTEEGTSWKFTELVSFFHTSTSDEPTKPGFVPVWEAPSFVPDFIELTPLTTDDDHLTWRCKASMKQGVKVPEEWLASDGIIVLSFQCKEPPVGGGKPKEYKARMGLRLPPLVELGYRFEIEDDDTRDYKGLELEGGELAADGEDAIGLIFFVKSRSADAPDEVAEGYDLKSVKLELGKEEARQFALEKDEDFSEPGQLRYKLRSKLPVLHTKSSKSPLTFKATGEYAKTGEKATMSLGKPVEVKVNPCPMHLKLWVVPGKMRGTSEAGAIAGVRLPRAPWFGGLADLPLEVAVTGGSGGPQLTLQDDAVKTTDADGEARWLLRYSGLSFDNVAGAEFRVKCRIGSSDQATAFPISVGHNLLEFLNEIQANAKSLRLTNPEFQHSSTLRNAADYLWPDGTLGLLYNFRWDIAKIVGHPMPPEWNDYVCGELAKRLLEWAMQRRYGYGQYSLNTAAKMNGIELGEYAFNHLHDFFGFNLSGNDPWKDAKFIDPWWNQTFDDQVVLSLAEERVKLAAAITFLISAAALIALFLGKPLVAAVTRFGPSIITTFRAWITAKLKGMPFNPKHTIGVFSVLGSFLTGYFWPTFISAINMFDDEELNSYTKYRKGWLAEQRSAVTSRGSLPAVEPIEPW